MSKLIIDIKLFPTGFWATWPPEKQLEQHYSIGLPCDAVTQAAEWSQRNIAEFIRDAIAEHLDEVQAAMDEERAGVS